MNTVIHVLKEQKNKRRTSLNMQLKIDISFCGYKAMDIDEFHNIKPINEISNYSNICPKCKKFKF